MQCLDAPWNGLYEVANPQPAEYSSCMYILATPQDIAINQYALTAAQGLQIATAIGILWATAYAFRVIGQYLQSLSIEKDL